MRRTKGKIGPDVTFTDEMKLLQKKESFLANMRNKDKLMKKLWQYLQLSGCQVLYSEADADLLMVQTAVNTATLANTVLVGDDTDLLILLIFHADLSRYSIFMQSDTKSKHKLWNIKHVKAQLGATIATEFSLSMLS